MFLFRKWKRDEARARRAFSVIARIPTDIWELIVDAVIADISSSSLDPSVTVRRLYVLLLVNSFFHRKAERALYRRIYLKGYPVHQCVRRIRLFETLAEEPHLARLVKSLHHPTITHKDVSVFGQALGEMYLTTFHRALHSLNQLNFLQFCRPETTSLWRMYHLTDHHPGLYQLLDGCPFHLHSLTLPFWSPEIALPVVAQQREIEELTILAPLEAMFSSQTLPKLQVLTLKWVSVDIVPLLSANQHILALRCCRGTHDANFRGGPYTNLRSLRMFCNDQGDASVFIAAFPSLRYLRLDFSRKPGEQQMIEICNGLQNIPFLRKMVFGGKGWKAPGNFRVLTIDALSRIRSLEWIYFGQEAWKRGKEDCVTTFDSADEWKNPRWWT